VARELRISSYREVYYAPDPRFPNPTGLHSFSPQHARRRLDPAASAANAAIDHIHDWHLGSSEWVTMGIPAPADNGYGIPEGIVFGFPCECKNGSFALIKGLEIDEYSKGKIAITLKELEDERAAVKDML
jgi:malate dehydrogenase